MTEVFSAIFGRKKPKAPLPPTSNSHEDEFEVIGREVFPDVDASNNNNNGRPPLVLGEGDYETLFSFLQVQNGNSPSSIAPTNPASAQLRPVRRAPPVPTDVASPSSSSQLPNPISPQQQQQSYGYRPAASGAEPLNSMATYLNGVPFHVAASLGGDHASRHELTHIGAAPAPLQLSDCFYSFELERQILDEAAQTSSAPLSSPEHPMPAPRRKH